MKQSTTIRGVLVTGAAGKTGRVVVGALSRAGFEVRALVRRVTSIRQLKSMIRLRLLLRLIDIQRILVRHGLDDFIKSNHQVE